jgi:hypothetical protein
MSTVESDRRDTGADPMRVLGWILTVLGLVGIVLGGLAFAVVYHDLVPLFDVGIKVAAFGILLLAIRRPLPRSQ